MKAFLLSLTLVSSLALAQEAASPKADAPTAATVAELTKDGAKFDRQLVTVTGKADAYRARTSKAGNPYFTFDLVEDGKTVHVFGYGALSPEPKDGAKVEVTGKFAATKRVGTSEIKNEVDASGKRGESAKVKLLK